MTEEQLKPRLRNLQLLVLLFKLSIPTSFFVSSIALAALVFLVSYQVVTGSTNEMPGPRYWTTIIALAATYCLCIVWLKYWGIIALAGILKTLASLFEETRKEGKDFCVRCGRIFPKDIVQKCPRCGLLIRKAKEA